MSDPDPVRALGAAANTFGRAAAAAKSHLLQSILAGNRPAIRDLLLLNDVLGFVRAFPDDRRVLALVVDLGRRLREWVDELEDGAETSTLADTGFPGAVNYHPFSYPVLLQMQKDFPGCTEIDWDGLDEEVPLHNALVLLVGNNECQGLDDIRMGFPEWCARAKVDPDTSDLQLVLDLFEQATHLSREERAYIYDSCGLTIRYELAQPGTGRCEAALPVERIHYQRRAIDRRRSPLVPAIRRPFAKVSKPTNRTRGAAVVQLALSALCARNLEISSLMYANPDDVRLLDCGRGLQVALVGVAPDYRDALEISYFFLILKNGVPIAYGPASVCLGCCEMGINLFPEFRGGEIHFIYSQFMRSLHQVLGVRYFYLTSYGMGDGNPEAIRTGAFWFYRKLGFHAEDERVEAIALEEEARMRADPGHRSSLQTLRRMSITDAYCDISGGACRRLDLGTLGTLQSQFVASRFGGDRRLAETRCSRQILRLLDVGDTRAWPAAQRRALRILAPILCMLPDLDEWTAADKKKMLRILKAKGGRSEARADALLFSHTRLREGLRRLASGSQP